MPEADGAWDEAPIIELLEFAAKLAHATARLISDPGFGRTIANLAEHLRRLQEAPSPAYRDLLQKRGLSALEAGLAVDFVCRWAPRFAEARNSGRKEARRAIAQIARNRDVARHAKALLAPWAEGLPVIQPLRSTEPGSLRSLLELAADGEASPGLAAAAEAALATLPRTSFGRPVSAASVAHELLLYVSASYGWRRRYTYKDDAEDKFVDDYTRATRIEFDDPRFDPRPALRRFYRAGGRPDLL
jgi:hypothetical protein